jgi:hypothetical protein
MSKVFLLVRPNEKEKKLEIKKTSNNSTELYKEMDFFKGERVIKRDDYISENEEFKQLNN